MKVAECSRCHGDKEPCARAGEHGQWVCQRCLWVESKKLVAAIDGKPVLRVVH